MTNVRMKIATANVEGFKSIFNNINMLVDTITFECYNDRVEINALDKSKTTFISCVMNTDYFEEYECPDPDRFNIDTTEFKKIIKSCKDDLSILFDDSAVGIHSTTKQFKIYQVNDDLTTPKLPNLDYFVKFEIPLQYLKGMVKDIELFAKDVTINASRDQIIFSTTGTSGEFRDTYTVDGDFSPTQVKLSTEKLSTCLGSDKVTKDVELQMATDMPLVLLQKTEGIEVTYLIAPRIDVSE